MQPQATAHQTCLRKRRRPILAAAGLAMLCASAFPASSSAQSRLFTVADSIEMQTFIDPYPFNPTALPTEDVKFSLDNQFFAVVTQRGVLRSNKLECTIWVFEVEAVREYLGGSKTAKYRGPRGVARMEAVTDDPCISDLVWLPNGTLAFLGRDNSSDRSLYTVEVNTGALKKLSPDGQDVIQFSIVKDTIAYTAAVDERKLARASEIVLTGRSILSALNWESPRDFSHLGTPAELWVIRDNHASAVIDAATSKPIQLLTDMLSLSPSGRYVAVTQHADLVPEAWVVYRPAFSEVYRLKASRPGTRNVDLLYRLTQPEQYALIDLNTGKVDPVEAPLGGSLLYWGPKKAIWAQDGSRILLANTFLPIANTDESEKRRRVQNPYVSLVDTISRQANCVAVVKQGALDQYSREGTFDYLNDLIWDEVKGKVILSYRTFGDKPDSRGQQEVYTQQNGVWTQVGSTATVVTAPFWVRVRQDLNEPPALFVADWIGDRSRKLWDPNPQLETINLGDVSVYQWQDATGREWVGGLVKPPNYVPGRRYPLVIQTHGFQRHQFMTVGTFTTAFAARPLAAIGIVVLQTQEATDLMTPHEASVNREGYEAAMDHLAADGLVDPERVGLIGFSRTGYYTLEALTKSPKKLAAATIADSDFLGYMQQLLGVDINAQNSLKKEGIAIYGSVPFGSGLKTWLQEAPAFALDKILAPVRIEVHNSHSLLFNWEVYAALRIQDKPVDLIQLPDAVHIVTKPLERLASEQGDVDWFDFWLNGHEDSDPAKAQQYDRWRALRERWKGESSRSVAPYGGRCGGAFSGSLPDCARIGKGF